MRGGGFTLLELVLVLLVAALMLAMAVPALRPFVAGREAEQAAGELVAMARLARSLAISEAREYRMHVDAEYGELWLSHAEMEAGERLEMPRARPVVLPEDVWLTWLADAQTAGRGYVRFMPDGRCDPSTFELLGRRGDPVYVASRAGHEAYAVRPVEAVQGMVRGW